MFSKIKAYIKDLFEPAYVKEARKYMDNRDLCIDLCTGENKVWRDQTINYFTDLTKETN